MEIEEVKRTGKRIKTGHLDVRVVASPLAFPRVGVIVPKYKRTIVERNQLRRRLRELARTELLPRIGAYDLTIRPWPNAYDVSFDVLAREIEHLAVTLGVVS